MLKTRSRCDRRGRIRARTATRASSSASLKPRNERKRSVDQVIESLRPQTVRRSGHSHVPAESAAHHGRAGRTATSVYQLTLQSPNLHEIYSWAPQLSAAMSKLPGFVDVNTDMQISSPQVMVDIDRDRAQALGVTPQQVQDALFSAYGERQASVIYAPPISTR